MKTILIATERDLEQNLLSQSMERQGYAILRSRDGLDALELARSSAPHLLLLNVVLPRLDGFALYRRCQQDEQLRQIPIVLFSTRSKDEKSSRFAQDLGVVHFVGNALRSDTLATTVTAALAADNAKILPTLPIIATTLPLPLAGAIAKPAESVTKRTPEPTLKLPVMQQIELPAVSSDIELQLMQARNVQNLFDSSPVSMWVVHKADQYIMTANQATAQLFGYSIAELLKLKSHNMMRADNAAQSSATQVFSFQHKDGHSLSLLLNARDVVFNGHAAELMVAQDVSYRVRGERAMADEIQRLKQQLAVPPPLPVVAKSTSKLPTMVDILRYAEDTDETTLLQYSVSRLAQAFNSPLAMFAAMESITKTMEVLAVNQRKSQHSPQRTLGERDVGERILIPTIWQPLLSSRTVHSSDNADDSLLVKGLPEISSFQVCSIISASHEPWLLLVGNREQAYSLEEQTELQNCGDLLAMLLLHKRQQLKAHIAQQRQIRVATATVSLLEKVIDQHDVYAAASGQRIASLAVAIARQMNLSEVCQTRLNLAARLHDIGHVLLPQSLLLKPGILDTAEQALMHSHAERGAQFLRGVDLGMDIADIVAQHHERCDGTGYPARLRGEQISIEARVLAVADVVEAMCAVRPYRSERGLPAALAEIRSGADRAYDLSVAQACEQVFKQTGNQWPEVIS
jgi:PAS domain S-box-containing protein